MHDYRIVDPMTLREPFFEEISKNWMLITVRTEDGTVNPMTASWGGIGFFWNRPIFWCGIRPQRYTHTLAMTGNHFTLSFYDACQKTALSYCGTHSGREENKAEKCGLEPVDDGNYRFYRGAKMILEGRKLYAAPILSDGFFDERIRRELYGNHDFHTLFFCEIERALLRSDR